VAAVLLTGSFGTARLFTSWRPQLHLLAETSGKNSIIVTGQADLELAANEITKSAFGYAGQKCSAASVVIATSDIHDRLCQLLTDAAAALVPASALDLSAQITPVIDTPSPKLARALSQLDDDEEWLLEPQEVSENLYTPAIKKNVKPGSAAHLTEFFGPVLSMMQAPNLATAISWQNQSEYGLTAGIFSLSESECELWLDQVQAGNLYINRGITGAVVQRQPFGGWKRSSVGPTAKAGGPNYVNTLRHWKPLKEMRASKWSVDEWWLKQGSLALDVTGLASEHNYIRYCKPLDPISVRIDDTTTNEDLALIKYIAKLTKTQLRWSHSSSESIEELVNNASEKVRWLSSEVAPAAELLDRGISLDARPIAQRGDIEAVRWVKEQSVTIAWHRYGNLTLGPKPKVTGLGDGKN
jgi:RHH-type proline utilization regulon transcriptional repressor/proline dehydrogenase/delta 1-pyrroline-5-carboxylate dehydrogenase